MLLEVFCHQNTRIKHVRKGNKNQFKFFFIKIIAGAIGTYRYGYQAWCGDELPRSGTEFIGYKKSRRILKSIQLVKIVKSCK